MNSSVRRGWIHTEGVIFIKPQPQECFNRSFWLSMGCPNVGFLPGEGCGGVAVATTILCAWSTAQPTPHEVMQSAENKQDQGCFFLLTPLPRVRSNHRKKIIFGVGFFFLVMAPSISIFLPMANASFSNFRCSNCFVFLRCNQDNAVQYCTKNFSYSITFQKLT